MDAPRAETLGGRSLVILVPVLARPHRVKPLLDSIGATTSDARVLFVTDPDDFVEQRTIRDEAPTFIRAGLGVTELSCAGNYAQKINAALVHTREPLIFLGADDLEFQPGWLDAAKPKLTNGVQVVGVNDLIPRPHRPQHATHFLITREYAEQTTIDGGEGPLHTGYSHWAIDDELIATAKHRGVYAYAEDSHVEHLHPFADKAADDSTYCKGRANMRADLRLFARRESLWR
jgi:hypothetical protein